VLCHSITLAACNRRADRSVEKGGVSPALFVVELNLCLSDMARGPAGDGELGEATRTLALSADLVLVFAQY
jgi:hypothetical protein